MRVSAAMLACALLASSCAGASARYGCPAAEGISCRSVSRVHSDVVSGRDGREPPELRRGERKGKGRARRRGVPRAETYGAAWNAKEPAGVFAAASAEEPAGVFAAASAEEPVYEAPRAVRIWIAPWADGDGAFHSAKYVWALPERGTWTVGGVALPAADSPGRGGETLRLRGTEGGR